MDTLFFVLTLFYCHSDIKGNELQARILKEYSVSTESQSEMTALVA